MKNPWYYFAAPPEALRVTINVDTPFQIYSRGSGLFPGAILPKEIWCIQFIGLYNDIGKIFKTLFQAVSTELELPEEFAIFKLPSGMNRRFFETEEDMFAYLNDCLIYRL